MLRSQRRAAAALLFLLVALTHSGSAQSAPALPPNFPGGIQLPARARGEDAITKLGSRLPEVAAFYRKNPEELRGLLRQDHTLWVDPQGRLLYICDFQIAEAPVTGQNIGTTDPSPFPPELTFRLHSRPGATKVIYLDFDGHDASTTSWGADAIARPFDTDGNPATFSSTERDRIVYIWQRVSADYAMYDIDVTTEDPGVEALRKADASDANYGIRVVIGGSSGDWYGSAGGVAYVGSFDGNSDVPCWVFPKSLGPDNEKYIAEAISHEAGHTLGLSHDGTTAGVTYYSGQGNWAPIMGVGYYEPIAQWSKGEYANANQTQDDLAVMLTHGAAYRADDHGNTRATATSLAGVNFTTRGTIERNTDLDFFSFKTGAGRVSFTVNRAPRDSNLRIEVSLYDGAGTLLLTTNSADTTAGTQPVSVSTVLSAGTYYFSVDGIGNGSPATTGYSDYASLGEYMISGTLPGDSVWISTAAGAGYIWTDTPNWSSNSVPDGAGAKVRINNNITGSQTINLATPLTLGALYLGDSDASHSFKLEGSGTLNFDAQTNAAFISKTTGAADTIALPIVLLDDLLLTNTTLNPLTLASSITGSGAFTKAGSGQVIASSTIACTGGTTISAGKLSLVVDASLAGPITIQTGAVLDLSGLPAPFTVASGQTLSGAGAVQGDLIVANGARLNPGGSGVPGTLALSNSLSLSNGAALQFDLAATETPGSNVNDLLSVAGDLVLDGSVSVDLRFLSSGPASPGVYTLIRYTGNLVGSAANFVAVNYSNRFGYAFDDTTPGEIRVNLSGLPQPLVWKGDGVLNRWDVNGATNWLFGASPDVFEQLDAVTFDDSGSTGPALNLSGSLTPSSITLSTSNDLVFAGSGKISGATGLTKQGGGILTLSTANDFTGAILVSAGGLKAGSSSALGATNGSTTIASGARLDVNGLNLGAEPIVVSGSGIGGTGALINGVATTQSNALRFVTFAGNTTLGGTGRWDIRANPTAALNGGNFTLTKTGPNAIWLADLGNTSLGNINLDQGTLVFQDSTTMGAAASSLTMAPGTTLSFWKTEVNALSKKLVVNGGTFRSDAGDNIFAGTVALNTNLPIAVTSVLDLQGVISGTGGLTNLGPGMLNLSAANTFTGTVTVAAGTLRTGNASALGVTNGPTVIASEARLDIGGFNLGAEPLFVTGDGLGNAGAIVNSGGSQQNALRFITLNGNTTFGGINRWDLRANPTAALNGNNKNLTKRGPNDIWLVNVGNSGLANITISEGLLGFQGTTTLGNAASNLTVSSGCTLALFAADTNILVKNFILNTARIYNSSGSNTLAGPCALTASNAFDTVSGSFLTMAGVISGSGWLNKLTAGTLVLATNNSYTGVSAIAAGTLQIGNGAGAGTAGSGAITNNSALVLFRTNDFTFPNVIYGSGTLTKLGSGAATLTAANTYSGATLVNAGTLIINGSLGATGVTVSNVATLRGAGSLAGPLIVNGTLAPGLPSSIAPFTVNNSVTLNGTTTMRISKSPALTNDSVRGITSLTMGGNLNVSLSSGSLASGDTIKLFTANSYNGTFSSVTVPAPPAGLIWSNSLAINGSISLLPVKAPILQTAAFNGSNLTLKFQSETGVTYVLQSATNIAPPIVWSGVSTNIGNGSMMTLNPAVDILEPQRFFRLLAN
jgi:autotransporter-associated beta strand protein